VPLACSINEIAVGETFHCRGVGGYLACEQICDGVKKVDVIVLET
jgi:hypothetical protein